MEKNEQNNTYEGAARLITECIKKDRAADEEKFEELEKQLKKLSTGEQQQIFKALKLEETNSPFVQVRILMMLAEILKEGFEQQGIFELIRDYYEWSKHSNPNLTKTLKALRELQ